MIIDEDHFVADVFHDAGDYTLTSGECGSRYVLVGVRILVDPNDSDDVDTVTALQDRLAVTVGSRETFVKADYDVASLDETRDGLLQLARGLDSFGGMFGTRDHVDPVHHLIGTAAGWGGLPSTEATYIGVDPRVPPGDYQLVFADVPVDAFWSVSVYNAYGFFEPNDDDLYSVNSVTGERNADGSTIVHFISTTDGAPPPNAIVTPTGWNYLIRLYRPRAEILQGRWAPPTLTPIGGS